MASLQKRLGELERRVELVEKATLEQGDIVAKYSASVKLIEDHANDLPEAMRTAIDELWHNQRTLEWQHLKILHMLVPDEFDNPGELDDHVRKEPADGEPPHEEEDAAEPAGP